MPGPKSGQFKDMTMLAPTKDERGYMMAIRPSYKLEPSTGHGLIEVERVSDGIDLEIYDAGTFDDQPLGVALTIEEATELAAMIRATLGTATPEELAALNEAQRRAPSPAGG